MDWNNGTLIYLRADNEKELTSRLNQLKYESVTVAEFREPDIGNQLTAIACIDTGERFEGDRLL